MIIFHFLDISRQWSVSNHKPYCDRPTDCLLVNYLLCRSTFVLSGKSNSLQVESTIDNSNEVTVLSLLCYNAAVCLTVMTELPAKTPDVVACLKRLLPQVMWVFLRTDCQPSNGYSCTVATLNLPNSLCMSGEHATSIQKYAECLC